MVHCGMRVIPRKVHGLLDYVVGLLLIVAPYLFNFSDVAPARIVAMAVGAAAIVYSLLTAYEMGAIKVIPFQTHLWLDLASGVVLAASPWLFGFADQIRWPHVTVGLLEIGAALMTRTDASARPTARA